MKSRASTSSPDQMRMNDQHASGAPTVACNYNNNAFDHAPLTTLPNLRQIQGHGAVNPPTAARLVRVLGTNLAASLRSGTRSRETAAPTTKMVFTRPIEGWSNCPRFGRDH